jgi:hypothetical protein
MILADTGFAKPLQEFLPPTFSENGSKGIPQFGYWSITQFGLTKRLSQA